MAEELEQMERREQRSLLDQIMGAVDGLARAFANQGTRLDRLEGLSASVQLPPAPSFVRVPRRRRQTRLYGFSMTWMCNLRGHR